MDVIKSVHFDSKDFGRLFELIARRKEVEEFAPVYLTREAAQSLIDQAYASGLRPNRSKAKSIHDKQLDQSQFAEGSCS